MPAVVFSMRNDWGELLVEERRRFGPGAGPKLAFPAVILRQFEPPIPAMMQTIRWGLGVTMIQAQQFYPQHFEAHGGGPCWHEDIDGNLYSVFAYYVQQWVGEILPVRTDNHAVLRWSSVEDILQDGLPLTQLMGKVIATAP